AAARIVCKRRPDLLDRHFTVELPVMGDEHFPKSALGVRPQDFEPSRSRKRDSWRGAEQLRPHRRGTVDRYERQGRMDVGIADALQTAPRRPQRRKASEALPRVAAVKLEMLADKRLQNRMPARIERSALKKSFS